MISTWLVIFLWVIIETMHIKNKYSTLIDWLIDSLLFEYGNFISYFFTWKLFRNWSKHYTKKYVQIIKYSKMGVKR